MFERCSGVLMHITSLPSPYGIGTLGKDAYDFVDFLRDAGQRYWQVLPLGHTGFGDSPYQCFSAAAGNYLMIDLDALAADGLLTADEIRQADCGADPDTVDFSQITKVRQPLLRLAFARIDSLMRKEIADFRLKNREWIEDYALFMALKEEKYDGLPLWEWPEKDVRRRAAPALRRVRAQLKDEIDFRIFMQYIFFSQWDALHAYARARGVQIIGDIPIYVSPDSADVWQNPHLFKVGADMKPHKVAGVPPDYYSETGQLWGNPVYDWPAHDASGYQWWIWRIKSNMALFDVLRIDHFRGLESYWEVDQGAENAVHGRWRKGPGMKLLRALEADLGRLPIVAEDLGIITDEVRALLDASGFPGMKVMIFGFDPQGDSEHLPHNYERNMIVYTSTHDSQSICEQILDLCTDEERDFAYRYLRTTHNEAMGWSAIKSLWASCACITMTTMQDVLSLGADARMNIPSTLGGNWTWRVRRAAINPNVAQTLRSITETYKRYRPYASAESSSITENTVKENANP